MKLSSNIINVSTNIPACLNIQEIQIAMLHDIHLKDLKAYITEGWQM